MGPPLQFSGPEMFKGQWLDSLGNKAISMDRFLLKHGKRGVNRLTIDIFVPFLCHFLAFSEIQRFYDIFLHFHDILLTF